MSFLVPEYSVVVPVYNGAPTLHELCARLDATFDALDETYEIILVDDGSQDQSWDVMRELHDRDPRVKIVRLQGNFGQHAAVLCGLRFSRGDFAITMDDDLQNLPEEVPKLIAAITADEDCDAVFGVAEQKEHASYRNLGSSLLNLTASYVFKKDRELRMSSFRIMRRRVVENLLRLNMPEPAVGTMLFVVTKRIKNVTVRHAERRYGRSGYNFPKMLRLTVNSILNYSSLPLQLVSQLGLFSAVVSLVLVVYFLIRSRFTSVAGWSSTVVLITFFGGMILFTLGFIGEYLVRIIKAVNAYPQYIVAYTKGVDDEKSPDPRDRERPV